MTTEHRRGWGSASSGIGYWPDSQGAPLYAPGGTWGICDRCGSKQRRQNLAKEWTSLIVCIDTCFDPRPPQLDPPDVYPEGVPLPDIRPRPPNIFVEPGDVTPEDL